MDAEAIEKERKHIKARWYWRHGHTALDTLVICETDEEIAGISANSEYEEVTQPGDTLRSFNEKWTSARRVAEANAFALEAEKRREKAEEQRRQIKVEAEEQQQYNHWRYRTRILKGPDPKRWCVVTRTSLIGSARKPTQDAVSFDCLVSYDGEDMSGHPEQRWFIAKPASIDALVKLSRGMRNAVIVDWDGQYTSIEIYDDYRE